MKKNLLISVILLGLTFTGCSSEPSTSHSNIVQGQWKLVKVSGSFAGIESNFSPGVIKWTFNPTTQTVTVINNNLNDNLTDLFDTGVYNYQIVQNPDPQTCSEIIKIDNIEMGCFTIVDGKLHIDQAFTDGYTATLAP